MKEVDGRPPSPGGKIYLIGFMGAGKSAVGARLAKLLGTKFVDLDRIVEANEGISIPQIFAKRGEEAFRRLESAALRRLSEDDEDLVVATGGGTATRAENAAVMRSTGTAVWLDPTFDVIRGRLDAVARKERPLFASDGEARALYEQRQGGYARAGVRFEVSSTESPDDIAERVLRSLWAASPDQAPGEEHR